MVFQLHTFENWQQSETDKTKYHLILKMGRIICVGQIDQILELLLHTSAGHGDDCPVESLKY